MKAFVNPLLFLVCILLLVFSALPSGGGVAFWGLLLCVVAIITNGTLGVARALTGRPSIGSLAWAVGFLVFGSMVWVLISAEGGESQSAQERALLEQRVAGWKAGQLDPYALDENGDGVVTLAAGVGNMDVLRAVGSAEAAEAYADVFARAIHRAAERNRDAVIEELCLAISVPVDARVEGMTPLHTASLNRARRAAEVLLKLGADANAASADGSTPLHNAVLADDAELVHLLMQHNADPKRLNADGRDAASYARSEEVEAALHSQPAAR